MDRADLDKTSIAGVDAANEMIAVSWPTGGRSVQHEDTVEVTVSITWTPVIFYVFGNKHVALSKFDHADCTLRNFS